ncbi:MAG: S41 family peptidase [Chromatiales bacterium]|jgi:carboxyl-terminal processing protease|nr:S41 family peptidase [Chromatiales bacterium]
MKSTKKTLLVLMLGLVLGVSLTIGQGVFAERETAAPLPLKELRTFTDVFANIKSNYVEAVDDKVLIENAVRGMLAGLDPHSTFLDNEAYSDLQVGTSGEFGGLGIEVGMEDGFVKVISPIDDTPAKAAGIEAGDLIIRLDDTPVKGLSLKEAVDIMRGKPGTDITLTIVREGQTAPIKATLKRAVIKVKSVRSSMLDDGFGYVRITQFQSGTGEAMLQALAELKKQAGGELNGLVLDLRNNPGGVLNAAVEVSDAFLKSGLVVYTEGRTEGSRIEFSANSGDVLDGAPIVVLVNVGSASASEIVAGALQDHKRAIIMGARTFGKGSVQTILPLNDGTALKLTTARYYTPSGRSIQAEGIVPDILLGNMRLAAVEDSGIAAVKEADLSRHLGNNRVPAESQSATPEEKKANAKDVRLGEDYQLNEALNLLRGLHIMQQRS